MKFTLIAGALASCMLVATVVAVSAQTPKAPAKPSAATERTTISPFELTVKSKKPLPTIQADMFWAGCRYQEEWPSQPRPAPPSE